MMPSMKKPDNPRASRQAGGKNWNTVDSLRLVGIPGTNKVMGGELSRLAGRAFDRVRLPEPKKEGQGTLVYPFSLETAALAVRYHRTSSRVLWGLYRSRAGRLEPLYDDLLAAVAGDGRRWYDKGATFSIAASNLGGFAAGERQVVGAVKNALIDGAAQKGGRLSVDADNPDLRLVAAMHDDVITVSMDLAGRPMSQRGYRAEGGIAPLRENLAAVLVMLSRYDARKEVLVDPMAGSGTIAIEAACMAQGKPVWVPPRQPSSARHFRFAPLFQEPAQPLFGDTRPLVIANDMERKIHETCKVNVANAGTAAFVETWRGDFRKVDAERVHKRAEEKGFDPGKGVILSNPPYGERLPRDQNVALYRDLRSWCLQFRGWRAGFLVANPDFEAAFGGRARIKKPLRNGPLRGYFYLYDL
jgi:23S rRNA G2445 N2-methylase RlmL